MGVGGRGVGWVYTSSPFFRVKIMVIVNVMVRVRVKIMVGVDGYGLW